MSRLLPVLTAENRAFWTGGAQGRLMITHCSACDRPIHPPRTICPFCLSRKTDTRPASGFGMVHSFTVNHHPWRPGLATPFALVVVDLEGLPGVRLTAEMVGVDPEAVYIDQPVKVTFLNVEDVWIPQFEPASASRP